MSELLTYFCAAIVIGTWLFFAASIGRAYDDDEHD